MTRIAFGLEVLGFVLFWIELGIDGKVEIVLLGWQGSGIVYITREVDDDDFVSRWWDVFYIKRIRRELYWYRERKRRAKIPGIPSPRNVNCRCSRVK